MSKLAYGAYGVCVIPNLAISCNGVELALKLWLPNRAVAETLIDQFQLPFAAKTRREGPDLPGRCAAVLEFLPYRKDDGTYVRDELRHPITASHGIAVVRADMRGSGNSSGILEDEYLAEEQQDGMAIIDWIARQPWSNGRVGIYGKSWGGFNGLQIGNLRPASLKAIISIYSTDDRYAGDCHYMGGCVLGTEMLSWASIMDAFNLQPPNPHYCKNWLELWKQRFSNRTWTRRWLQHQLRDDFWKHGSVCEKYRINIPTLLIGGWRDPYTDAVWRLMRNNASQTADLWAIVGPWSHDWPDQAVPGPNINFMQLCLKFWKTHLLSDEDRERMHLSSAALWSLPRMLVYEEDAVHPDILESEKVWPGQWLELPSYGSDVPTTELVADLLSMKLQRADAALSDAADFPRPLLPSKLAGRSFGNWLSFGDARPNQLDADRHQGILLDVAEPLSADWLLIGAPVIRVVLSSNQNKGQMIARLCCVKPSCKGDDEFSQLISYGILNLNHDNHHEQWLPLEIGRQFERSLTLGYCTYRLPAGHVLRLTISDSGWPYVWPSSNGHAAHGWPNETALTLHKLHLWLPIATVGQHCAAASQTTLDELGRPVHLALCAGVDVVVDSKQFDIVQRDQLDADGAVRKVLEKNLISCHVTESRSRVVHRCQETYSWSHARPPVATCSHQLTVEFDADVSNHVPSVRADVVVHNEMCFCDDDDNDWLVGSQHCLSTTKHCLDNDSVKQTGAFAGRPFSLTHSTSVKLDGEEIFSCNLSTLS